RFVEVLVEEPEEGRRGVDAEAELLVGLAEQLPRRLAGPHQRPVEVEAEGLEVRHGPGYRAWPVRVSRPRKSCVSPRPVWPSWFSQRIRALKPTTLGQACQGKAVSAWPRSDQVRSRLSVTSRIFSSGYQPLRTVLPVPALSPWTSPSCTQ